MWEIVTLGECLTKINEIFKNYLSILCCIESVYRWFMILYLKGFNFWIIFIFNVLIIDFIIDTTFTGIFFNENNALLFISASYFFAAASYNIYQKEWREL